MDLSVEAMMVDSAIREATEAWTAAHGVNVVANGNGVTRVDRHFETDHWRFHRAGSVGYARVEPGPAIG